MSLPSFQRIAVFGGVYSNHLALAAALKDASARGAEAIFCLGDMGAFGPNPDKVFPLLHEHRVRVVRGNYDDSLARGHPDCQCGYTDPRDNHFAALSYRYTCAKTDPKYRTFLAGLPDHLWVRLGTRRVLMCHGSPRRINEFLWESTTSTHFLEHLTAETGADCTLVTHTGIKWQRALSGGRLFVNVGVLGRPENDGTPSVWYALVEAGPGHETPVATFVPVTYDHERLAHEMRAESLPAEFIETILTGWWTTCLENLPARERAKGRF